MISPRLKTLVKTVKLQRLRSNWTILLMTSLLREFSLDMITARWNVRNNFLLSDKIKSIRRQRCTKSPFQVNRKITSGFKITENKSSRDTPIQLNPGSTLVKMEERSLLLLSQKNFLFWPASQEIILFSKVKGLLVLLFWLWSGMQLLGFQTELGQGQISVNF